MTQTERIYEIEIDPEDRLRIRPAAYKFRMIYRSASEVHWDEDDGSLFSPPPREWAYAQWFAHIVAVCKSEYGIELKIDPSTVWRNISDEIRESIMQGQK